MWKDNINIDIKDLKGVAWIQLTQCRSGGRLL